MTMEHLSTRGVIMKWVGWVAKFKLQMISISWSPPSSKDKEACLARTKTGAFNYDSKYACATAKAPFNSELRKEFEKNGFFLNHRQVRLGSGEETFIKGRGLLANWRHFQLDWALVDSQTQIKRGEIFCVCAREFFTWVITPLEILYVKDSHMEGHMDLQSSRGKESSSVLGNTKSKGLFMYGNGTLKGHLLAGEERFSVRWEDDDSVWYEIFSFSRPAHFLSTVTYPYVKWRQQLFAKQSTEAMFKQVNVQDCKETK